MLEQVLAYIGSMNRIWAGGNALKAWGLTRSVNGAVCIVQRLLDQPIRSGEYLRRNCHADLLCRLEINHELKLGWLFNRQVGGLGSLQDSIHIIGYAPIAFHEVRSVGHERTGIYKFSVDGHRR